MSIVFRGDVAVVVIVVDTVGKSSKRGSNRDRWGSAGFYIAAVAAKLEQQR